MMNIQQDHHLRGWTRRLGTRRRPFEATLHELWAAAGLVAWWPSRVALGDFMNWLMVIYFG